MGPNKIMSNNDDSQAANRAAQLWLFVRYIITHAVTSPAPKNVGVRTMFVFAGEQLKLQYIHTWDTHYICKKLFNGIALIPRGV